MNDQHKDHKVWFFKCQFYQYARCWKNKIRSTQSASDIVFGGPEGGKVTHYDTLMQERRDITHINMMDLLQQYAIGNSENETTDFSHLSSKTVAEVLMLEMKMAPAAKAYLISGHPRSMRDVVEYFEKKLITSTTEESNTVLYVFHL
uniref:Uncharacterized protein n=1 Tax=Glossina austeni TaxID=7395 RepID=A0A1A9UWL4_GLOAU